MLFSELYFQLMSDSKESAHLNDSFESTLNHYIECEIFGSKTLMLNP